MDANNADAIRVAIAKQIELENASDDYEALMSAKTLEDAAIIHCRFWQSPMWNTAVKVRDRLIDEFDPEWPHNRFWEEVEKLAPRPE